MEIDLAGVSVFLAMPVHRDVSPGTVKSLLETMSELKDRGTPFFIHMETGGSLVHHSRSSCVHAFLKEKYNRIFWVDSDITWNPNDFVKFLALSTQMEVVSGAYPCKSDPPVFMMGVGGGEVVASNDFGCLPVGGVGLGFTCIQRHVMERLAAQAPKLKFPNHDEPVARVFRCDQDTSRMTDELYAKGYEAEARGEDMAFFADIRALGYQVMCDPSITLGHIGPKEFRASLSQFCVKVDDEAKAA